MKGNYKMNGEEKDSQALVRYEPKPLTIVERMEKKRQELSDALKRGDVGDPITVLGVTLAVKTLAISAFVSAGISLAGSPVTDALCSARKGRRDC
jgi:hypothetical protein